MTVFVNTFNPDVFTSLTVSFVVKWGFFKITIPIFLSILSEINHFLPVINWPSTQWVSFYFLIMLRIVDLGTNIWKVFVSINYLHSELVIKFSHLCHGCRTIEFSRYVALTYFLFHHILECYRLGSILFHFQMVFVLSQIKKKNITITIGQYYFIISIMVGGIILDYTSF